MLDFNEPVKNEIGGGGAVPADLYRVRVESFRMKRSRATNGVMPSFLLRIAEGRNTGFEHNGHPHFEDLWLGSAEDPEGEDPATRTAKGRKDKYDILQLFVQESMGKFDNPQRLTGEAYYTAIGEALVGAEFWVRLTVRHEPASKDPESGKVYDAKDRNEIKGVFGLNNPKLPGSRVNGPAGAARSVPRGFTVTEEKTPF